MTQQSGKPNAPVLDGFAVTTATYDEVTKTVYRAGSGPAVIVIHEVPGITPLVAAFGKRLEGAGFTVLMPSLFGTPGKEPSNGYIAASMARACVSREFHCFALHQPSPVTGWLRAFAADAHAEHGGPGVGVVGMCLTGGFGLAMMAEHSVIAPVLSQPALPLAIGRARGAAIGLGEADWRLIDRRIEGGCEVLGLRFSEDRLVPKERFELLRDRLGDSFLAVEIDSSPGNPFGIAGSAHSVLTEDLVDEPGHPTASAADQVVAFLQAKLHSRAVEPD